jgi:hypothetical protein
MRNKRRNACVQYRGTLLYVLGSSDAVDHDGSHNPRGRRAQIRRDGVAGSNILRGTVGFAALGSHQKGIKVRLGGGCLGLGRREVVDCRRCRPARKLGRVSDLVDHGNAAQTRVGSEPLLGVQVHLVREQIVGDAVVAAVRDNDRATRPSDGVARHNGVPDKVGFARNVTVVHAELRAQLEQGCAVRVERAGGRQDEAPLFHNVPELVDVVLIAARQICLKDFGEVCRGC